MNFIDRYMLDYLKDCFNHYGIEGTEQVIKRVYENHKTAKIKYLKLYNKILKGG